jgi:hypothetical protein
MTRTDRRPGTPDRLPNRPGGHAKTSDGDSTSDPGQGVVRNERGEEQPADKERARLVSREDAGGDPPGFAKRPPRR